MALVPKVHHAIIDGVSGAEVMAAFFDLSPIPAPRPLFGTGRRPIEHGRRPDRRCPIREPVGRGLRGVAPVARPGRVVS